MLWECINLPVRSLPGAARASAAVKLHLLTDLRAGDRQKHWESAGIDVQPASLGVIAQVCKG